MKMRSEPLYATANIFPSVEHVVETNFGSGPSSERMVPTGPPVWRSQLMSCPPSIFVKKRVSGEKVHLSEGTEERGSSKVLSRLRVTASNVSTVFPLMTAMNLLHGDHATVWQVSSLCLVATIGSHDIGNPRTTLAKGRVYCLYISRTIDVGGDRGSAEWYICGADMLMTSKKVVVKRE